MYDINKVRADFPILSREVYGKPLVYLDNAATTQKPLCVLDAMREEYLNVNANVHRGVHYLSQQATDLHEAARERVRQFINARKSEEVVFTRGTTEAINLVAQTFCESQMQAGDEVLVTDMEHHSNIVPWQLQAQKRGIVVRHFNSVECRTESLEFATAVPSAERLQVGDDTSGMGMAAANSTLYTLHSQLTDRTRLVAITHVSNVLGTVNPVKAIIAQAHAHGIPVLVDAAQSAPHLPLDVQDMDCDFLAFSGHKMYGPTGIGVLYGKEEWLDRLPPYQGGGEMIDRVSWEKTTFERLPFKFEAGTPDYVATHGLATAIDYMCSLGLNNIMAHEQELTRYCLEQMQTIPNIRIFGPVARWEACPTTSGSSLARLEACPTTAQSNVQCSMFNVQCPRDAVISFLVGDIHHLDMGTLLDRLGIAVRTGHHCAQPLMDRLGVTGTVRASFALYNTKEEVDILIAGIRRVSQMF